MRVLMQIVTYFDYGTNKTKQRAAIKQFLAEHNLSPTLAGAVKGGWQTNTIKEMNNGNILVVTLDVNLDRKTAA